MAGMIDSLEGIINDRLWYHYDVAGDVLYLRFAADRAASTVAEETDDGVLLLKRESDDAPVGLTIVKWWKRFGKGTLPDSMQELHTRIEPWAAKLAA